jgi:hypothetical protein
VTGTGPGYVIVAVTRAPNGGGLMVVRKRGGQLRQVWVPPGMVNGPDLERLAAGMIAGWPDRPPMSATGR